MTRRSSQRPRSLRAGIWLGLVVAAAVTTPPPTRAQTPPIVPFPGPPGEATLPQSAPSNPLTAETLLPQDEPPAASADLPLVVSGAEVFVDHGPEGVPPDDRLLWWRGGLKYVLAPTNLLWENPLANPREPRMYGKWTNFRNDTIDTGIGAQFGLARWEARNCKNEGIQFDVFGAVFTRFNEGRLLVTSDYRFGLPWTYAKGPWQAKLSYEHTSTHVGDEFFLATGRLQVAHVRDEVVLGLSRRFWDRVRVYGQYGYSFLTSRVVGNNRSRFDWGVEWNRLAPTGLLGQPFAAFDMDLRSDQNYDPRITVQVGWQWRNVENRHAGRLALEIYDGPSPYGQFFRDHESFIGFAGFYDW